MADEFAAMAPTDYRIEILGINWAGTGFNPLMTAGRDLPWLQDPDGSVTTSWGAGYRDFVMLDPANGRPLAAFNLTTNDLGTAKNYNNLKAILLEFAELRDDDGDRVSDYWEEEMFAGGTKPGPADDNDGDNASVLLEYSLASREGEAGDLPEIETGIMTVVGERYHTITFRQRLGASGGLGYAVESSDGLSGWNIEKGSLIEVRRINPYDGTGTELVTYRSVEPISAGGGQLRVRVELP